MSSLPWCWVARPQSFQGHLCKEPALVWLTLPVLGESRGLERIVLAKHAGITQAEGC